MNQRILHHGTLLFNTNLNAMQDLLNPSVLKMKSKGVDSVRARVINLNLLEPSLTQHDVVSHIATRFLEHYGVGHATSTSRDDFALSEEELVEGNFYNLIQKHYFSMDDGQYQDVMMFNDALDLEGIGASGLRVNAPGNGARMGTVVNIDPEMFGCGPVDRVVSRMADRNWVLGRTPDFSNNLEFKNQDGFFDVYFDSEKGWIIKFQVFSDALFPNIIESLNAFFNDKRVEYGKEGVLAARGRFLLESKLSENENQIAERFFEDLAEQFE